MHGTFPKRIPEHKPDSAIGAMWTSLAFAAIPLIVAIGVTLLRFGTKTTLGNILEVLAAATTAASM
jgi:hypothetical protein